MPSDPLRCRSCSTATTTARRVLYELPSASSSRSAAAPRAISRCRGTTRSRACTPSSSGWARTGCVRRRPLAQRHVRQRRARARTATAARRRHGHRRRDADRCSTRRRPRRRAATRVAQEQTHVTLTPAQRRLLIGALPAAARVGLRDARVQQADRRRPGDLGRHRQGHAVGAVRALRALRRSRRTRSARRSPPARCRCFSGSGSRVSVLSPSPVTQIDCSSATNA